MEEYDGNSLRKWHTQALERAMFRLSKFEALGLFLIFNGSEGEYGHVDSVFTGAIGHRSFIILFSVGVPFFRASVRSGIIPS